MVIDRDMYGQLRNCCEAVGVGMHFLASFCHYVGAGGNFLLSCISDFMCTIAVYFFKDS
jgi:hypothetical protein